MALFDFSVDKLPGYRSASVEPEDFDAFWTRTLTETRAHPLDARFERVDVPLTTVEVYDASFSGFGGDRIRGWLVLPAGTAEPLPVVVEYLGYGGGRGLPHTHLLTASAGYAHFVMDTRGQGAGWGGGDTVDPGGSGPAVPGYMTRGIDDPDTYYYRRVFTEQQITGRGGGKTRPDHRRGPHRRNGGPNPGRRDHARGGRPRARPGGRRAQRPVPVRLPARHDAHRQAPLPRDRRVPQRLPRPRRRRALHARLLRRRALRRARHRARALLDGPGGPGLPALDGVRGVQRVPGGGEGHQGLRVQRPRGWRHPSGRGPPCVAAGA
ncbi:acetyl xylan esterase [Streptomyces sp. SPB074]|nr:acetyl xylan esterase [Streptomyces sp. SPB074]